MEPEGSLPHSKVTAPCPHIIIIIIIINVNILENKASDGQLTFVSIPEYSSPCSSTDIMFTTYNA
jgi:hypothetical protein